MNGRFKKPTGECQSHKTNIKFYHLRLGEIIIICCCCYLQLLHVCVYVYMHWGSVCFSTYETEAEFYDVKEKRQKGKHEEEGISFSKPPPPSPCNIYTDTHSIIPKKCKPTPQNIYTYLFIFFIVFISLVCFYDILFRVLYIFLYVVYVVYVVVVYFLCCSSQFNLSFNRERVRNLVKCPLQ